MLLGKDVKGLSAGQSAALNNVGLMSIMIGVTSRDNKEFLAIEDGYRESE